MVNRIEPIRPKPPGVERVNEDGGRQHESPPDTEEDGEADVYDKLSEKTDWNILFDKTNLWQHSIEVQVQDIKELQFVTVNLKTDPCLLQIKVILKDGTIYHPAFLSLSRSAGLRLKSQPRFSHIPLGQITRGSKIVVTVPRDENGVKDEITRVTRNPREKTVSYTLRRFTSRRGWMHRLGLRDPVSQRLNTEIIWIYVTVTVVLTAFAFGVFYLSR